jgi:NitT/TauT family transport system permease protein
MHGATIPAASAPAAEDAARHAWLRARRRRTWQRRLLPPLGILAALAAWWAIVAGLHVQTFIAPSPLLVLDTMVAKRGLLWANVLPTALEAGGGFVLGNLRAMLFPVMLAINAIPTVAKAPILVLILGNGIEPRLTIAALVCFFPTLVNVVRGLEAVPPQAMDLMRVLSASRSEIFWRLRLFTALPHLFSALRISASLAVIGAVVGEWIGTTEGVGALIIQAMYDFDSPLMYAAIVLSATLSGVFFLVVVAVERMTLHWQPQERHDA